MVKEVHEITETLIKIKAGTFSSKELDSMHFDDQVFLDSHNGHDYCDDFDDDYGDFYGDECDDDYYSGQIY